MKRLRASISGGLLKRMPRGLHQRLAALFFVLVMILGATGPISPLVAEALAASQNGKSVSDKVKPLDVAPSNGQPTPVGEGVSPYNSPSMDPKPQSQGVPANHVRDHEDASLRTANSDTYVNTDGSKTMEYSLLPVNYQKNGKWEKINTNISDDKSYKSKNSLDNEPLFSNPFVDKPQAFSSDAADMQTSYRPFADGLEVSFGGKTFRVVPVGAKNVRPTIDTSSGHQIVIYKDAWPGVDVQYEVRGGSLKETIVLNRPNTQNVFAFVLDGAAAKPDTVHEGGIALDGIDPNSFFIAPLNVTLPERGIISEQVASYAFNGNRLAVIVNADWLQKQSKESYPMAIDPSFENNVGGTYGNFYSYKSDGYSCGSSSCDPYAGELYDNGWKNWRTMFRIPFDQLQGGNTVTYARLRLHRAVRSYWTGTPGASFAFWNQWAPCFGYGCVHSDSNSGPQWVGDDGWVDVTHTVDWMDKNGQYGGWFMMNGEEYANTTFKHFEPLDLVLHVDYDQPIPMAQASAPADNQVVVTTQPSLSVGTVSDPDGQQPLYYFRVSTNPNAETGAIVNSGWTTANQWTVPDGVLQDGTTYYWHVYTWDGVAQMANTIPNWIRSFKVDLRTGKDSTQAYDQAGPASVDLATGNAMLNDNTHTISALGGSIGLNLTYNSPMRSSQGLDAQYWNNTNMSGTPAVTRTDPSINFDWGLGAPSASMNADNFSARWTGYFVAPQTGSYYFGGIVDDGYSIYINNTLYQSSGCCGQQWGSTPVSLTAGQMVPIRIESYEFGGAATMKFTVKGAVAEQVVPKEWLRTAPKQTSVSNGLVGRYYTDDGSHTFPSNELDPTRTLLVRTDPAVNFNWGSGSPVPGAPVDNFMVRWRGYIAVPADGSYTFGAYTDDGLRVKIGANPDYSDVTAVDYWTDAGLTVWGTNSVNLKANKAYPITVEFYEHGGGAAIDLMVRRSGVPDQEVPSSWLMPKAPVLPAGWNLSVNADGNINYERLKVNQSSVVLTDSSGYTHEYVVTSTNSSGPTGYRPPVGEDGQLVRNSDNTYSLTDSDGRVYLFDVQGQLTSVTTPQDDRNPAALQYIYGGSPSHLLKIVDAVDTSRYGQLYYGGDSECSTPANFDPAPIGMLCAFKTTDGAKTNFYYKNNRMARVERPGSVVTDYGYTSSVCPSCISSLRDSLATDTVAASVRADDSSVNTEFSYDVLSRVSGVTMPAAKAGDTRIVRSYDYQLGTTAMHTTPGSEPNGYSDKVDYDGLYRTVKDYDKTGQFTITEWDAVKDLVLSTTGPTGLKSTTIYDAEDRPTDTYGPAPAAWFGSDRKPLASYVSQVPHTQTNYDEGMKNLAVAFYGYRNGSLVGAPKLHQTGINTSNLDATWNVWGSTPPVTVDASKGETGWGFSATGKLTVATAGTYYFHVWHDDGARLYVDDSLVTNNWNNGANRYDQGSIALEANKPYRIKLDYYDADKANSSIDVYIALNRPPQTGEDFFGALLKPDYSLTTSTKVYDSQIGDVASTINYGSKPELGQAQSTTVDPTGLSLATSTTYEPYQPGSLMRQTSKTLPGGTTTTYAYYNATEARDNPCTPATEAYKQAGFIKQKIEADPDGAGPQTGRTSETIYDDAGRAVASRFNNDPWTCATYDARGRVTQTVVPDINGRVGRTVTTNYNYQSNPLKVQVVDSVAGTTVSEIDLLGRTVSTTDTFGNTSTATYDNLGHLSSKTTPVGTESYTYDTYDRTTEYKLDGTTYATITYDQYSRVQDITYNQSKDANNNQLKLEQVKRDALQRTNGAVFRFSDGTAYDETVSKSQSGMVTGYADAFNGNTANSTYAYDKAGRLTGATIDGNTYSYGYGAPSGSSCNQSSANLNANKNSNRTTFTANGITTTYCYNQADQLISSSDTQLGTPTYDDHGNTTQLAGNGTPITFTYDASDSNTAIQQGSYKVEYVKSANGSVLTKKEYQSGVVSKSYRYLASGSVFQTCNVANANNCTTVETYLSLPGGVMLTIPANSGTPPASTDPASPWFSANVGGYNGTSSVSGGTFTLTSNAYDIWGSNDQSHMLTQALNGDGQIIARVVSQTDTNEWAKAGLIIKDAHNEGSNYAVAMVTGSNGLRMEYNYATDIDGGSYSFPNAWLKLVRSGSTVTTYKSTDGTNWTQMGSATVSIPNSAQIGLFALSGDNAQTTTAVFDNVTVTPAASSTLPSGWAHADIGNPAITGDSSYSNGTFTVTGAGTDVWAGDDQFQFAYQALKGDGSITARLTSQTDTNSYAKAGVVIKQSTAAGADYFSVHRTAENGTRINYSFDTSIHGPDLSTPNAWFKLVRAGNTVTGYMSPDGTNWTQVGSTTLDLPETALIGLYVASVNPSAASTATFDNVTVTGNTGSQTPPPAPASPVYSIKNFHGDTAITVGTDGKPASSVFLYEPFGQAAPSATFGTNSNPANATDQSMGWAADPTRKVQGAFTLAIVQMGARVYIPSMGRFLQVDPIEGGTLNAYVYVSDPVNLSDYTGKYTCILQCGATITVIQPVAQIAQVQPTAPAAKTQGPGSTRSNTGRTSAPAKASPAPDAAGFIYEAASAEKARVASMPGMGGNGDAVYLNVGGGRTFMVRGVPVSIGGGVKLGLDGPHFYSSSGVSIRPGFDWHVTISPSNPTGGCSPGVSAFSPWLYGGSYSADGSWEVGIGSPGISADVECTR